MTLLAAALFTLALDTDGMVKINGQRTFFVGAYAPPNTTDPRSALKAAGFNLVHAKATSADLQLVHRHGLFAWTTTGAIKADNEAAIRKTVLALRQEPALIAWEIEDEPTFVWKRPLQLRTPPETIIATRRLIESIDRGRLFYLNQSPTNLVSTLRRYNAGTDIVATDIYPVMPRGIREQYALWPDGQQGDLLNETISQVGQYADKMRQVNGPAKPVFMVLQGFAWETIQKQPNPRMILYPTRAQVRFMAYQAIVHGVNGILYWGLHLGPENNPAWQAVRHVAAELKTIALELAEKPLKTELPIEYFDTGHSLDRGVALLVKPSKGGALLITVNEDKNPIDAAIGGLNAYRSCESLDRTRKVVLTNGVLREAYAPFEAKVYRCVLR